MMVGLLSGQQEAKARGLPHTPHPLRAEQVPLLSTLTVACFFISFRSEIYSPDPLERLVCLFPRQLLPW